MLHWANCFWWPTFPNYACSTWGRTCPGFAVPFAEQQQWSQGITRWSTRALPSCCCQLCFGGHSDAMILLLGPWLEQDLPSRSSAQTPMAQSKQPCCDGYSAVSAHFQTHVGIGSTSAGITAKSWRYLRLQYYFIVSLMAFPFSTQPYTTPPP